MNDEEFKQCLDELYKEKEEFLKANPDFEPDADFWDSHNCRMFADEFGYCQYCGDVIYGSYAYQELYGGE